MKIYDESWSVDFLIRLEKLRRLDNSATKKIRYIRYAEKFHHLIADRLLTALYKKFGDISELNISIDDALHYLNGEIDNELFSFIKSFAKYECKAIKIAYEQYGVAYLFFALMILKKNDNLAKSFSKLLIISLIASYREGQLAREKGVKGGRPAHRLKNESLELIADYQSKNPISTPGEVVKYVRSRLNVKYSDIPSGSTIRKWIINS